MIACSGLMGSVAVSRSFRVAAESGPAISRSTSRGVPVARWAVSQVARARRRDRLVSPMRMLTSSQCADPQERSCGPVERTRAV